MVQPRMVGDREAMEAWKEAMWVMAATEPVS